MSDLEGQLEPDDAGDDEGVPPDLLELFEVLEYQRLMAAAEEEGEPT